MEANNFIARLKADTAEKQISDLREELEEYKLLLYTLAAKDRGLFGLNVLRTLCWNLDKAPIWQKNVDNNTLLTLAIACVRETRQMDREDRVKALACIYHIHKYAVRLNKSIAPELVLKISIMPFELDSKYLLKEYHKTYWHILADRLLYLETLKTKAHITKQLPKLTADIIKIIDIYDSAQFCSTVIVFLIKKLHMLFSETDANKLVLPFRQIFTTLCEKDDISKLGALPESDFLDIYTKLNDCLYVVADNSSKMHFKDSTLGIIVLKCATLVAHRKDLFYCIQMFYVKAFCKIISHNTDVSDVERVFNSLQATFLEANKLGYDQALLTTYPYLNQLLRLYIEYKVTNPKNFTEVIQESCLKLILFFTKKLKDCKQVLKCENCPKKTGLHDAFRLSLLIRHLTQNVQNTDIMDLFYSITTEQYAILAELEQLGCSNYQKYFRKLQTDVHNTAITLNKSQLFEISIKLFDIYLRNELKCGSIDHKNISRAFFNKSICELDSKLYEKALMGAFLSLTFAGQEGLKTNKYMSLVMDIKARELKSKCTDDEDVETDELQLVTVLDACITALDSKLYGDLMPFLTKLKFSELLRHEFSMYAKMWPSAAPIGGVWRSLHRLARGGHDAWLTGENENAFLQVLYDVVLETPSVVRTIHCPYFSTIVKELLEDLDNLSLRTPDERLVHIALLFLQCEYDLSAASQEYQWKITTPSSDPDKIPVTRTIPEEHEATRRAILAVQLSRDLLPTLQQVSKPRLGSALQVLQTFVPLLQQLSRDLHALQLAHYCTRIADYVGDRESFLVNAGVLLTSPPSSPAVEGILDRAMQWGREGWGEAELAFLCDAAMYYYRQGKPGLAAQLVHAAQAHISNMAESQPDLNLDLAVGRVLEAQYLLHGGSAADPSVLTAVNGVLRHYLALTATGARWAARRLRALCVRARAGAWCARACAAAGALGLRARARGCAAPALPGAAARAASLRARILDLTDMDTAQIYIDKYLKDVLGLDESRESVGASLTHKQTELTPTLELESMRDHIACRARHPYDCPARTVPAFRIPDFFHHHVKCACFACLIPTCILLSCKISSLEALMYNYANENEIASNYFRGASNMINLADNKLKLMKKVYLETYDEFVVESVWNAYNLDLKTIAVKLLIDAAFFKLKNEEFDAVDDCLIEINDMLEVDVDQYLKNDVLNLMAAAAYMKNASKKPKLEPELDEEFENLHLSPNKVKTDEPPSTPVTKPLKPPKPATKMTVKPEEIHKQRKKIPTLHLDDEDDFEKPKPLTRGARKDKFKVPNPVIPKPTLEEATPRPSRSKPQILITNMATPNSETNKENVAFFTPIASTPEQFFTPMTSVKTYQKRSLRKDIVKNLEQQFSTAESSKDHKGRENSTKEVKSIKDKSKVKDEKSKKENSVKGSKNVLTVPRSRSKREEKN